MTISITAMNSGTLGPAPYRSARRQMGDEQKRSAVKDILRCSEMFYSGRVGLEVRHNLLILSGNVNTHRELGEIYSVLSNYRRSIGLKGIISRMTVKPLQSPGDDELAAAVENLIRQADRNETAALYPLDGVQATSHGGVIYLTGTVPDSASRATAARLAESLPGVLCAVNHIEVGTAGTMDIRWAG